MLKNSLSMGALKSQSAHISFKNVIRRINICTI